MVGIELFLVSINWLVCCNQKLKQNDRCPKIYSKKKRIIKRVEEKERKTDEICFEEAKMGKSQKRVKGESIKRIRVKESIADRDVLAHTQTPTTISMTT